LGEGGLFAEAGHSTLGGKLPVNVSGGLESQGHLIGATGVCQVAEVYGHLRRMGREAAGRRGQGRLGSECWWKYWLFRGGSFVCHHPEKVTPSSDSELAVIGL